MTNTRPSSCRAPMMRRASWGNVQSRFFLFDEPGMGFQCQFRPICSQRKCHTALRRLGSRIRSLTNSWSSRSSSPAAAHTAAIAASASLPLNQSESRPFSASLAGGDRLTGDTVMPGKPSAIAQLNKECRCACKRLADDGVALALAVAEPDSAAGSLIPRAAGLFLPAYCATGSCGTGRSLPFHSPIRCWPAPRCATSPQAL